MSSKNSAILAALAFAFSFALATPAHATPAPRPTAVAGQTAPAETQARTSKSAQLDSEAARYAQREQKSKKQQDYQGGNVLVIGISTGAAIIALIIVLLIL